MINLCSGMESRGNNQTVKEIRFSLFSRVTVKSKSGVLPLHTNSIIPCCNYKYFSLVKIIDVGHGRNLSFCLTKVIKSEVSH